MGTAAAIAAGAAAGGFVWWANPSGGGASDGGGGPPPSGPGFPGAAALGLSYVNPTFVGSAIEPAPILAAPAATLDVAVGYVELVPYMPLEAVARLNRARASAERYLRNDLQLRAPSTELVEFNARQMLRREVLVEMVQAGAEIEDLPKIGAVLRLDAEGLRKFDPRNITSSDVKTAVSFVADDAKAKVEAYIADPSRLLTASPEWVGAVQVGNAAAVATALVLQNVAPFLAGPAAPVAWALVTIAAYWGLEELVPSIGEIYEWCTDPAAALEEIITWARSAGREVKRLGTAIVDAAGDVLDAGRDFIATFGGWLSSWAP